MQFPSWPAWQLSTMVPPTPGPTAVAEILSVDLGWVVMMGLVVGLPTAIIAGPIFGRFIAKRIYIPVPEIFQDSESETENPSHKPPSFGSYCGINNDTSVTDTHEYTHKAQRRRRGVLPSPY